LQSKGWLISSLEEFEDSYSICRYLCYLSNNHILNQNKVTTTRDDSHYTIDITTTTAINFNSLEPITRLSHEFQNNRKYTVFNFYGTNSDSDDFDPPGNVINEYHDWE